MEFDLFVSGLGSVITILITIVGCTYYIHRDMKADMEKQQQAINTQSARTDRLYEMFIDLLKENKK
jgi:hypothetical protein